MLLTVWKKTLPKKLYLRIPIRLNMKILDELVL